MPQQQLPFVLKKSDTMGNEIAEDVGHLFEVGFNIGILAYIRQHEEDFSHHLDNLYIDDLRKLHFPVIAKSMLKRARIIAQWNRHIVLESPHCPTMADVFSAEGISGGHQLFR